MQRLTNNILFNLAVLTFGAAVYSFGIKDIVVAKGLMSGGVSGVALLLFYLTGALGPGVYYFLLNLPLMVLGWVSLSRRFILYTVYGMGILSLFMQLMPERALIADPLLAAVFGGAVMGAGSGIMLRTLGSAGGTDILAIWLNQKYNLRIGQFNFVFNLAVFAAGMAFYDPTLALYSIILSYANSKVMDTCWPFSTSARWSLSSPTRPTPSPATSSPPSNAAQRSCTEPEPTPANPNASSSPSPTPWKSNAWKNSSSATTPTPSSWSKTPSTSSAKVSRGERCIDEERREDKMPPAAGGLRPPDPPNGVKGVGRLP